MLKLNSRTPFEAIVMEALDGDDRTKANDVRTRIIYALDSEGLICAVYTRYWLWGEINHLHQVDVQEFRKNLKTLSDEIKNSNLSLTYKYVLCTNGSNTDGYVEGDNYNDLYLQGDVIYDFLGMYCDLLQKYNNTFDEGLKELGLNK